MSNLVTIHWFKKGLRLHDNAGLLHAVTTSKEVYPVYIWDEEFIVGKELLGQKRIHFLFRCLKDLQKNLQSIGSDLLIFKGDTVEVLASLVKEWNVTQLTYNIDTEAHYRERDQSVCATLSRSGIDVVSKVGHTLYDIDEIWKTNEGKPPLTYRSFLNIVGRLKDPPGVVRDVCAEDFRNCITPQKADHNKHDLLWFEKEIKRHQETSDDVCTQMWPGGETAALERFNSKCDYLASSQPSTRIQKENRSHLPNTTDLSPYLCLGCLSPRLFYHSMTAIKNQPRNHRLTTVSLQGQIMWRDFFYTVSAYTPNFTVMKGNPICLQIAWNTNSEYLTRWSEGQTGYPWIDAIMRQLRVEGRIHHLARQAVACFLTRGDLWLSWEDGQKVFEQHLLDADYSMNSGNWLWLSSCAFYHRYNKIYHPVNLGKRLYPTGDFVRRYVKELENFPTKYIYDPWKAPLEVQQRAGCVIGEHYPSPIVNHLEATKVNLAKMKEFRSSQANIIRLSADSFDKN